MQEIQDMLGISKANTYKFAQQNKFPCVKLGRRYLAPKQAFDDWLNNCGNLST